MKARIVIRNAVIAPTPNPPQNLALITPIFGDCVTSRGFVVGAGVEDRSQIGVNPPKKSGITSSALDRQMIAKLVIVREKKTFIFILCFNGIF